MLLAAATIPRLKPEMDRSRVREAARSIQLYLSSARNLAISTGRTCGVMIEPLAAENGCSMSLTQVETPLPYGGDFIGALATVTRRGAPTHGLPPARLPLLADGVPLHPGDLIQIGYQGYRLILKTNSVIPAGTNSLRQPRRQPRRESGLALPTPISGPYKIWRWPTKSLASAFNFPRPPVST